MQYVFADCILDVRLRQLRRGGSPVDLQPQVFDLLVFLIENRDRVVSRDDLLAAIWGGRIVSESTLASRISAARSAIGDTGNDQRLIRTVPRKGVRFIVTVVAQNGAAPSPGIASARPKNGDSEDRDYAVPDRPSIAVLPFANLSGEPEQDYFADGVVEEIITELARNRSLFVIARNSSFVYRGAVDIKKVGRELGVRYVLEGSVRKAADARVRITGQLIDAMTGAHIWADRIDGTLADIFDLQDKVAASVVGAIEPTLRNAEIRRAQRKPTASLDAYDHVLRAIAEFHAFRLMDALAHCRAATAIDGHYAQAHAMAAQCIGWRKALGMGSPLGRDELAEGGDSARRAVAFGADDPTALWMAGQALLLLERDYDNAVALIERALLLCPNAAPVWNASGWTRWSVGDGAVAIDHFNRAMRMSPVDPHGFLFRSGIGWAHFIEGRYDDALDWSDRALALLPNCITSMRCKVATCGHLGDNGEARDALQALLKMQPDATVTKLGEMIPLKRPEHMAAFLDGLRKAGMAE